VPGVAREFQKIVKYSKNGLLCRMVYSRDMPLIFCYTWGGGSHFLFCYKNTPKMCNIVSKKKHKRSKKNTKIN